MVFFLLFYKTQPFMNASEQNQVLALFQLDSVSLREMPLAAPIEKALSHPRLAEGRTLIPGLAAPLRVTEGDGSITCVGRA
jgi:hypothetical protein